MKYIFIDTEFTDFINTELISIGLVSDDGQHEFYAELNDYRPQVCSEFVRMNVIPHLDLQKHGMTRLQAAARLFCWLEELGEDYIICPDNKIDWELFIDLIEDIPKNVHVTPVMLFDQIRIMIDVKADVIQTPDKTWFFNMALESFKSGFKDHFDRNPDQKQHHALADARANMNGWKKFNAWINQHY